ncbi:atherin-like [Ahaetulla prasina]|uniref:atherin-like n=1 Tax=Ahaetulla prasina TaxID=499056 RepID=UPI00264A0369|nr:atherin-like [Ahaetulla prasina]
MTSVKSSMLSGLMSTMSALGRPVKENHRRAPATENFSWPVSSGRFLAWCLYYKNLDCILLGMRAPSPRPLTAPPDYSAAAAADRLTQQREGGGGAAAIAQPNRAALPLAEEEEEEEEEEEDGPRFMEPRDRPSRFPASSGGCGFAPATSRDAPALATAPAAPESPLPAGTEETSSGPPPSPPSPQEAGAGGDGQPRPLRLYEAGRPLPAGLASQPAQNRTRQL